MRLITSLAAATAALDAWAADRLDAWVENTAGTVEAPREEPVEFPTTTDVDGLIAAGAERGLAGAQRDRWLTEVKTRLDASTGGPWVTEERDAPTGRIVSPYGVIATGVDREGDRNLIEDARGDLFGMLAVIEHDDQVIAALKARSKGFEAALADANTDAGNAMAEAANLRRELEGMLARERDVDHVLDSLDDGRLKLAEYVDPETPAGRVKELITTLLHQVRDAEDGAQVQHLTDALHVANSNNAAMKQELDRARALLEAAQQDGTASHLEVSAVMGAYDRGISFDYIEVREDSLAERVLAALMAERGRASDLERKLDAHHRHDAATDADAVRARAAERILAFAAEELPKVNDTYGTVYISGLETAAALITDNDGAPIAAAATVVNSDGDLIVTYGGGSAGGNPPANLVVTALKRHGVIDADDARLVEPGGIVEAVLNTGGTVAVDHTGEPHIVDTPLVPLGPGTLITADGTRHEFTSGTAKHLNDDDAEDGTDA
jgi:hypothetical protein